MDHQSLKVNATALRVEDQPGHFVLIYNVNVPIGDFGDPTVARRVADLLEQDFAGAAAFYQLTATYFLQNRVTGEEKHWSGSFFAAGNARGATASPAFLPLDRQTLERDLRGRPEDVLDWFEVEGLETAWELSRLTSVVVNVNAKVRRGHPALGRRGLLDVVARRNRRRRAVEFVLP
jgi:hypothetical protein